jgi:arylsulfatase A-like enzyme
VNVENVRLWKARILLTACLTFIYIFSEWLFFLTKPSSISITSWTESLIVFATTPVWPVLFASGFICACWLVSLLSKRPLFNKLWDIVSVVFPSTILASTFLLLVDNFTITIFDFGVRSAEFPVTIVYALFFIILIAVSFRWIRRGEQRLSDAVTSTKLSLGLTCLIALLVVLGSIAFAMALPESSIQIADSASEKEPPGILLIGSDGLNADHMSAYGYNQNTTPNISQFAKEALVFENAYANASRTLASLVSILTGKLPTATRVICPPDILRGEDVYQHLPGILRRQDYRSIQLTVRGYGDASDANMRMAFDSVNFRSADELFIFELTEGLLPGEASYLLHQMYERLTERLLHIFGIREMPDPFAEIMGAKRESHSDSEKMNALIRFIENSKKPFFAHIHFMGTHGNRILRGVPNPENLGAEDLDDNIASFYDDAIQRFDGNFKQIIEYLKKSGRLESTVVVLYSDHGWKHATRFRVPLMMRFPKRMHTGVVRQQVQNIDIAPTILAYLNIPQPEWMTGQSLIAESINPCRPVISVWPIRTYDQQLKWKHRADARPPFFTLGAVGVVTCHRFYKFDLEEQRRLTSQPMARTNDDCSRCERYERPEIRNLIHNHLIRNGYDAGSSQ